MNRKGVTIIGVLVVVAIVFIISCFVGCCTLVVKGYNSVSNSIETLKVVKAEKMESNPPLYEVGDIVFHKATDKRLIVSKNNYSWNEVKGGWNIRVKDGGFSDKLGGFVMNEKEVKTSRLDQ